MLNIQESTHIIRQQRHVHLFGPCLIAEAYMSSLAAAEGVPLIVLKVLPFSVFLIQKTNLLSIFCVL